MHRHVKGGDGNMRGKGKRRTREMGGKKKSSTASGSGGREVRFLHLQLWFGKEKKKQTTQLARPGEEKRE